MWCSVTVWVIFKLYPQLSPGQNGCPLSDDLKQTIRIKSSGQFVYVDWFYDRDSWYRRPAFLCWVVHEKSIGDCYRRLTIAYYTLFMHDPTKELLLPKLSHFLLAIVEMSDDDLSHFLSTRQHQLRHQLPCFELSIIWHMPKLRPKFLICWAAQHINNLGRMHILWDCSEDIFTFADPEQGEYILIKEVRYEREVSCEWVLLDSRMPLAIYISICSKLVLYMI